MDLPSLMRSLYPSGHNYEDTSGRADTTSSSESLGSMMRNFQFPLPPIHNVPPVQPLQNKGSRPLPRNNSWATESKPNNDALQEILDAKSIEAYITALGGGEVALTNGHSRTQPPVTDIPNPPSVHGENHTGIDKVISNYEHTTREGTGSTVGQLPADPEDKWTDIPIDGNHPAEQDSNGSSRKEKHRGKDASSNDDGVSTSKATPSKRNRKTKTPPGEAFTIFSDEEDRKNHPQPLGAHPSRAPLSHRKPLAPTTVNTLHASSVVRAPWYRQRAKNGNLENHRSSIYGPGALARKVQQEVMITVNVELDVLRREMDQRFMVQKKWFEFEIQKSQVWALAVEDENRKLREEMAKERKRREGEKGGRINLC
ncbi:MAG: hypothetical protein Q9182_002666 [Xanthomendoza sp. 2 TL-2023]